MAIDLNAWRFGRVIALAVGWIVAVPVLAVCYLVVTMYLDARASGSGGIGAVSIVVPGLAAGLWVLPPLVLIGSWGVVKIRAKRGRLR
jgi:hypothetical protein